MVRMKGVVAAKQLFRKKREKRKKKKGLKGDSTSSTACQTSSTSVSDSTTPDPETCKIAEIYEMKLQELREQHQATIDTLRIAHLSRINDMEWKHETKIAEYETRIEDLMQQNESALQIFHQTKYDTLEGELNTTVEAKRQLDKKYVVQRMQCLALRARLQQQQKDKQTNVEHAAEWKRKFLTLKSCHDHVLDDVQRKDARIQTLELRTTANEAGDIQRLKIECEALKEERKRSWRKWCELIVESKAKDQTNLELEEALNEIIGRQRVHDYGYDQVYEVIHDLSQRITELEEENNEIESKYCKNKTELKYWRNLRKYDKTHWKRHMVLTKSFVIKTLQLETLKTKTNAAISDLEQCVMELNTDLLETIRSKEILERKLEILTDNKYENIINVQTSGTNGDSQAVCYEQFQKEITKYQDTKIQIEDMTNGMHQIMMNTGQQFEEFGEQMKAMMSAYESRKEQFEHQINGMQCALNETNHIHSDLYRKFAPFLLKIQGHHLESDKETSQMTAESIP